MALTVDSVVIAEMLHALIEMDVGLYRTVDQPQADPPPEGRIITVENYTKNHYGPRPEPEPDDYYWCERCQENHLKECFDDSPKIVAREPRTKFRVEIISPSYAPVHIRLEQQKNFLVGPEVKWENISEEPWEVSGSFFAKKDVIVGYEDWIHGENKPLGKNSTIKFQPEIRIG